MWENRMYGSEGGESGSTGLPYPYQTKPRRCKTPAQNAPRILTEVPTSITPVPFPHRLSDNARPSQTCKIGASHTPWPEPIGEPAGMTATMYPARHS